MEDVRSVHEVPASTDFPSELFEGRITISDVSRDKVEQWEEDVKRGQLDYDKLVDESGTVFTSDTFMDEYGLKVGDEIDFTIYDGDRQIPLSVTIQASVSDGGVATFVIPEETYEGLGLENNSITNLFVSVDDDSYDEDGSSEHRR